MAESMSDIDSTENNEKSNKKSIKELRAKIQAYKKSVSKGDKKKKKEINLEIAALEKEIQLMREVGSTWEATPTNTQCSTSDDVVTTGISELSLTENTGSKSKAQRKREKKEQKERERAGRIAEGEVREEDTLGYRENAQLLTLLEPLRLTIKDIPPDGNCLYAAFSDQLSLVLGHKVNPDLLRVKCADYIRTHHDQFIPFITNPSTGDLCTQEEFDEYCNDIENPSVWGGQVEIVALSHVYECPVTVHQVGATPIVTGAEFSNDMLHLSYHKHLFALGKHYNSLVPL